jgi:hypothetical protein
MTYAERITHDRRLLILKLLEAAPGHEASECLLNSALDDFGHHTSADRLRADLAWLAEQGLVETEDIADVIIATATRRGVDVAQRRASVPGVGSPSRRL